MRFPPKIEPLSSDWLSESSEKLTRLALLLPGNMSEIRLNYRVLFQCRAKGRSPRVNSAHIPYFLLSSLELQSDAVSPNRCPGGSLARALLGLIGEPGCCI